MLASMFVIIFCLFTDVHAGVTDIPPVVTSDDEVMIETVTRDTLLPANILDATGSTILGTKAEITSNTPDDEIWVPESNPIFRAIRDFIFQAGDGLLEATEMPDTDPTEELVKIIEKGLVEATTMFLAPTENSDISIATTNDISLEPVTILQIEKESNGLFDNIVVNGAGTQPEERRGLLSYVENMTLACTNCYSSLQTCVHQCFTEHNCNDVQRQVRTCPPTSSTICNFFTQWNPEDECKTHEDCKSPLLCCNDGCTNKCSPGIWRH